MIISITKPNIYTLCIKSILLCCFILVSGCDGKTGEEPVTEEPISEELTISVPEGKELVYKDNEAIQCESNGITVNESAQILINMGIDVVSSYCGESGVVMTVCGAGTSAIYLHVIDNQNTQDAINAGFGLVSELDEYRLVECEE